MKKGIITALKLALICGVATIALAALNRQTAPLIAAGMAEKRSGALQSLLPGDSKPLMEKQQAVVDVPQVVSYTPVMQNDKMAGYVVDLVGIGYGGDLEMIAVYNNDGSVVNARLIKSLETPGFGKAAEEEGYMDIFIAAGSDQKPIAQNKNQLPEKDRDTVSGATITFSGVSKALLAGSVFIKSLQQ